VPVDMESGSENDFDWANEWRKQREDMGDI
jgi:hypothetical protein